MRDIKYDIARSLAMIWIVGVYHLSEYINQPLHEQQWARVITWGCLGTFTFISAYFLTGKNELKRKDQILTFYKKRVKRFYPLFVLSALTMLLIGFNTSEQTWKGLLGISTFCAPQINTLWYISMLMTFYLLTPFLQQGTIVHKLFKYITIITIVILFKIIFHTGVDNRFFYYFTVYMIGVICARHASSMLEHNLYSSRWLQICGWLIYITCITIIMIKPDMPILMMIAGIISIYLLLTLSKQITKFPKLNRLTQFFSYGSMAAYLFHRQIYYIGLSIPGMQGANSHTLLYLIFIVLPIIFIISYYIQLYYDRLMTSKHD